MNKVRIIGGQFKRRLISFEDSNGLRPTPDRVRETLFNWLMWDIQGRSVLDLCAGSGVLGLEALSRGASFCTFVEPNSKQANNIKQYLHQFSIESSAVLNCTAQVAITALDGLFDLMFLDPPYALNLWTELAQLYDSKLTSNALIYIEADRPLDRLNLPAHWLLQKSTKAGTVHAGLYMRKLCNAI